jgi:hypothetical protein
LNISGTIMTMLLSTTRIENVDNPMPPKGYKNNSVIGETELDETHLSAATAKGNAISFLPRLRFLERLKFLLFKFFSLTARPDVATNEPAVKYTIRKNTLSNRFALYNKS